MLRTLGHWFTKKVKSFFYAMGFFFQILKETLFFVRRKQVAFRVLVLQIYFTGVNALSIITFIALAMGVVIILQGITILPQFGQQDLVYIILITIITRELGPILTAFIVIARSGTAIATELGHMVVTHQMEAYISVGISPVSYLIVPRFLGVTISIIILTIYFNIIGLFASFFITQILKPIQFMEYFEKLISALKISDITMSLVKSFVFGVIISSVSTYHAFRVKVSSTEIPQVVIHAVGQCIILCIIANVIITLLFIFFL